MHYAFLQICAICPQFKKKTSNFFFDISGRFWPWWSVWNGNPEVPWWMMRPESWGCVSHVATAMGCRLNEVSTIFFYPGNGIELLVSQLLWENQSFFLGAKNLWRNWPWHQKTLCQWLGEKFDKHADPEKWWKCFDHEHSFKNSRDEKWSRYSWPVLLLKFKYTSVRLSFDKHFETWKLLLQRLAPRPKPWKNRQNFATPIWVPFLLHSTRMSRGSCSEKHLGKIFWEVFAGKLALKMAMLCGSFPYLI